MDWLPQINADKILLFVLVLTRVSGLAMTAPIFGTRDIPTQVRVLLSVALALLVLPSQWHTPVSDADNIAGYTVLVGGELVVGLCLGLGVVILFSGAQLAGELVANVAGLSAAEVLDPTTEAGVPVFSRLTHLVTMATFVCIGGHRIVMAGLLDTYQVLPPGGVSWCPSLGEAFVTLVGQSCELAIRAAAPVLTALLLSTLVLGLIGRTLPQLNVMILGFNLNSMLTFAVMSITLGSAAWLFQDHVAPTLQLLIETLRYGHVATSG
ncbi:MAG: flagellar biosynthetic protein FliR [Planctomycetota bacterium]